MPAIEKSVVTLRVGGDDLEPEEITRLLGVTPTHAHVKGEQWSGEKPGRIYTRRSGLWRISAADREPEDMNGQIQQLLGQLTVDLMVWRELASRFEVDLFCGLFMKSGNDGMALSPESMTALGERGITLILDIYCGDDEEP